jgi:hypothetical protein
MKKVIVVFMALMLACSLFACSGAEDENDLNGVVNPVHEATADEILETLGISMNIPENAQDTEYFMIDSGEGPQMAQAVFTLDGVEYTYRIKSSSSFEDISGAYFEWENEKDIEISYCSGKVFYNEGQEGICLWYDTVPGLMYSLYAVSGASESGLETIAGEMYVPAEDVP